MAVQKSKVSRSRGGMRRSHDHIKTATLSVEQETGSVHHRHHVSPDGYYRGKYVMKDESHGNDT